MLKHILFITAALFINLSYANAAEVKPLSKSATSWDGAKLEYPKGQAELSIVKIEIGAGELLDFHCHPVPSAAYVLEGDLQVNLKDGNNKRFKTGDAITEVVGRAHSGKNLSEKNPVKLIVFYAGAENIPLTIHGKEVESGCKE